MLHYWQWLGNHFWQFCCIFIKKIFSYRPVNADKPNFVSLLVITGAAASFTSKILSFETVAKRGAILNPKTVNIQGYSELREPIRTHVNRYPLIWWILIVDNLFTLYKLWSIFMYKYIGIPSLWIFWLYKIKNDFLVPSRLKILECHIAWWISWISGWC